MLTIIAIGLICAFLFGRLSAQVPVLRLLSWSSLEMEERARHVLTVMRSNKLPDVHVLGLLNGIKADIKHGAVPEDAIDSIFELFVACLRYPAYNDAGFSTLHHLLRRLCSQDQVSALDHHARRIIPLILEFLILERVRVPSRALQALADLWATTPAAANIIKSMISDTALQNQGPNAKVAAMQLILKVWNR